MRHLAKQIFESFFRRLTEYRQKRRIHNATYGIGVIGSFQGKSADVVKLLPVYSDDWLVSLLLRNHQMEKRVAALGYATTRQCIAQGIAQNPEGVLPFCIYFIQTRCKSVFGEGQTRRRMREWHSLVISTFSPSAVDILPSGVLSMGESHKIECRQKTIFLCRPIYDG